MISINIEKLLLIFISPFIFIFFVVEWLPALASLISWMNSGKWWGISFFPSRVPWEFVEAVCLDNIGTFELLFWKPGAFRVFQEKFEANQTYSVDWGTHFVSKFKRLLKD